MKVKIIKFQQQRQWPGQRGEVHEQANKYLLENKDKIKKSVKFYSTKSKREL